MNITGNDFIPVSVHTPLDEIRSWTNEPAYDHEILVHCLSGKGSYFTCKVLAQNRLREYKAANSYRKWKTAVGTN